MHDPKELRELADAGEMIHLESAEKICNALGSYAEMIEAMESIAKYCDAANDTGLSRIIGAKARSALAKTKE